jgi:ABC-type multidrug transport system ATPase subunit
MITKLTVRKFKNLEDVTIDLGQPVVFIGPNNSGKTSALQVLTLWETGYKKWKEKRGTDSGKTPKDRPGITINRNELNEIPISETRLLWKDKHIYVKTEQVFIDVIVEGITENKTWTCGFEFYFANDESIYCRPMRIGSGNYPVRMPVPDSIGEIRIAFLQPMSGLADREFLKQTGEIDFLLGQGQTAQVIRNLCFNVFRNFPHEWELAVRHIKDLFGVEIIKPEFTDRSEIIIKYKDTKGTILDLPSSGRGVQQTLLLLVYLYSNPNSILLLDEPDAHLEILRQRQTFNLICEIASQQNSQILAASHSEVVLSEAASLGTVVAFIGKPHTINNRPSQLIKSLTSIGWDQYSLAEQKGWVLYLEDSSDLAILKAFAEKADHPAFDLLKAPFVHYVSTNLPNRAREHFYGLKEAKEDLVGIAIFDRLEQPLNNNPPLIETMWPKREIENFICSRIMFMRFANNISEDIGPLFRDVEKTRQIKAMEASIKKVEDALITLGKIPWGDDIKTSDEFMNNIFREYSEQLQIPLVLRKNEYHRLVSFFKKEEIPTEIIFVLDLICKVANNAVPALDE